MDLITQQNRWFRFLDALCCKDCEACKHSGPVPGEFLCQRPNKDTECGIAKNHFEPRSRPWNVPPDDPLSPKEFCDYPGDCDGNCIVLRGDEKVSRCTHYRPDYFFWQGLKFTVKGLPIRAGDGSYIYRKR